MMIGWNVVDQLNGYIQLCEIQRNISRNLYLINPFTYSTRCNPRAQTHAIPRLRSAKRKCICVQSISVYQRQNLKMSFNTFQLLSDQNWWHISMITVCAKNYWAHWPVGPVASADLQAQTRFYWPKCLTQHNVHKISTCQSGQCRFLFTGPIGNWHANGVGPVLISQTVISFTPIAQWNNVCTKDT